MFRISRSAGSNRKRRSNLLRLAVGLGTVATAALTLSLLGAAPAMAGGTCPTSIADGQSSGWCGLYPGTASTNIQEYGQVTLSSDGTSLTVDTESASTGVVPDTSFACLTATDPGSTRLQETLCAQDGGVWVPFSGGTVTIDLTQYPQFLNTEFNVQVAANQDANDANGDAFYDNFTVMDSTVSILS